MKWVAIALLASTPAYADTLAQRISRRDNTDVARLREMLPDESARCALGVIYIFRDDLTLAAHYLEGCRKARIAPEVAGWVRLAAPRLDERLRMSELAALEVTTRPAGLFVSIDTVPGELFATPVMIWLPAGKHVIEASGASLSVKLGARDAAAAEVVAPIPPHSTHVDPRVATMRENDCAIHRKRYRVSSCQLAWDEELFEVRLPPKRLRMHSYDPRTMIVQTAEEL